MNYLLTVDIGTTSVKCGLFNRDLEDQLSVSQEYELITPQSGYVELEPERYWQAVKQTLTSVMADSKMNAREISAIALCSQGETLIPVDSAGRPLHNAVVWLDSRAVSETDALKKNIDEEEYYRTTGLVEIGPQDPLCKLLWFKNKRSNIYENTAKFLLLTDYIAYRLTGVIATEWTMMSSTGYYDINRHAVWHEGLGKAGIDAAKIPDVKKSGSIVGSILPEAADELNLSPDLVVIVSANDQMCGAVGGGNMEPGVVTETTGTALALTTTIDKPDFSLPQKFVYYLHVNGKYLVMPYNPTAGILLKWFKDEFCVPEAQQAAVLGINVYQLLDQIAAEAPPLSHGMMAFPHFAGKVSPNQIPEIKGAFINVGLDSKKRHFLRAIMEGVAFSLNENIKSLESAGMVIAEVRSLGGGAKSRLWNQLKADVLNKPIVTLACDESASLGVAMIAAVSLGWFSDLTSAGNQAIERRDEFLPDTTLTGKYETAFRHYLRLDKYLTQLSQDLEN